MTLAILAAATIYVVVTGLRMHHTFTADLATCPHPEIGCTFFNSFRRSYNGRQQLLQLLVVAVPALIGTFWGAPPVTAEIERARPAAHLVGKPARPARGRPVQRAHLRDPRHHPARLRRLRLRPRHPP